YHYVLLPAEAWEALVGWFGGGPALPRKVVGVDSDDDELDVQGEPSPSAAAQLYPEHSTGRLRSDSSLGVCSACGGPARLQCGRCQQ
ncbi:unnamed protein product, partial [Chrysoparadoxa australica]